MRGAAEVNQEERNNLVEAESLPVRRGASGRNVRASVTANRRNFRAHATANRRTVQPRPIANRRTVQPRPTASNA